MTERKSNQWFLNQNGQQSGPFTDTQLWQLAAEGKIAENNFLWREGYSEWIEASNVSGLLSKREELEKKVVVENTYSSINPERKTDEQRKQLLQESMRQNIANGARIESQHDFMYVAVKGRPINHLLHFFIGIFTIGFWWLVWLMMATIGSEERAIISIDEYGKFNVQRTKSQ